MNSEMIREGVTSAVMDALQLMQFLHPYIFVKSEPATLRDRFAMAAPNEIPDWFPCAEYKPPHPTGRPTCWPKHGKFPEGCEACNAFAEKMYDWKIDCDRAKDQRDIKRFFAWRFYYADRMLAAREAKEPTV